MWAPCTCMSPPRIWVYLFTETATSPPCITKHLAPEQEPDGLTEKPTQQTQQSRMLPQQTSSTAFTPLPVTTQPIRTKHMARSPPCNSRVCEDSFTTATLSMSSPGDLHKSRQSRGRPSLGWLLLVPLMLAWCLSPGTGCGVTLVKGNQETPHATRLSPTKKVFLFPQASKGIKKSQKKFMVTGK